MTLVVTTKYAKAKSTPAGGTITRSFRDRPPWKCHMARTLESSFVPPSKYSIRHFSISHSYKTKNEHNEKCRLNKICFLTTICSYCNHGLFYRHNIDSLIEPLLWEVLEHLVNWSHMEQKHLNVWLMKQIDLTKDSTLVQPIVIPLWLESSIEYRSKNKIRWTIKKHTE